MRSIFLAGVFPLFLISHQLWARDFDICPYLKPIMTKVSAEVGAAIPVEVWSTLTTQQGETKQQRVRIHFDLWDEKVTFAEHTTGPFPLAQLETRLCRLLSFSQIGGTAPYTLRVFLNPQLEGSFRKFRSIGQESYKLLHIDWSSLVRSLHKKTILLERTINK